MIRWAAVVAAAVVVLLWFIPMTSAAGGVRAYLGSVGHLWSTVAGRRTTFASPWLAVARIITIGWIFVLCFGSASLLLLLRTPKTVSSVRDRCRFLAVWIVPGFLFFACVFLNYVNSGYLLVLSPPLFAVLAGRLSAFTRSSGNRAWARVAVVFGVAANCALFGFAPLYCTRRSVGEFEREMMAIEQDFRTIQNPAKTLIIGFDSHFLGYRHAGYYLPDFVTVQYPEVGYSNGRRVFLMNHRNTSVVREFSIDSFERFVLFPLPEDAEYATYLKSVLAKLPNGALETVTVGSRKLLTGPIEVIPLFFPTTAQRSITVVVSPKH